MDESRETIILSKLTQEQKTNTTCFHLQVSDEQWEHLGTGKETTLTELGGGGGGKE